MVGELFHDITKLSTMSTSFHFMDVPHTTSLFTPQTKHLSFVDDNHLCLICTTFPQSYLFFSNPNAKSDVFAMRGIQ